MRIDINENIKVEVNNVARKIKKESSKCYIFLSFSIYERGINQFTTEISTRIKVSKNDFKNGEIIGRSEFAKNAKGDLKGAVNNVSIMLHALANKKIRTSTELLNEIKMNGRLIITGKPPRGQKTAFISKMQDFTYQSVMESYLAYKQPCKERQQKYPLTLNLLKRYFADSVPLIDQITKEDLEKFKKWVSQLPLKPNTICSYLYMVAAVFNHALRLEIIQRSPLPEGFGGSFINNNVSILSESEIISIRNLEDSELSDTDKIAKYSALMQAYTGMGYSELGSVKYEHKKYDKDNDLHYIQKNRNKTKVEFVVDLGYQTRQCWTKLNELTGNDAQPFNLPTIEYALRQYRKIGKKAGITTKITTYTFRHSYAVILMNNQLRLEDVQKRMGHANIRTTQIYAKVSLQRMSTTSKELESKSKMHQLPTAPDSDCIHRA